MFNLCCTENRCHVWDVGGGRGVELMNERDPHEKMNKKYVRLVVK